MYKSAIDIYISTCPVPYKYNGDDHDGTFLKKDKYCIACKNKQCDLEKSDSFLKCPSKMLFKTFSENGTKLQIYGFTKKKDTDSKNAIDERILSQWLLGLSDIINFENEQKKNMWAPFHDITPCISLLFRNLESIVSKYPGRTINEKIENQEQPVPYEIKRLFKTTSLLDEQLKMIRYTFSEGQIPAGKITSFPVYKVIDKLKKIFEIYALEKNFSLFLTGNSYNAPLLYDSFSSVPFILLDNAIKYTLCETKIQIEVRDIDGGGVEFSVSSLSTICDESIFEKGHRGHFSQIMTDRGMGMGLYVAKQICDANNARICHTAKEGTRQVYDDVAYCFNTFTVRIDGLS